MTDIRIGQGFDVHAFGDGDHVMLGGVRVPHTRGVLAHSDGDVALHALCDAMLGALALGDIGQHFPPSDPRWKGADSRALLRHCDALIRERGWRVGNCDLTLVCERPKVGPHAQAMREAHRRRSRHRRRRRQRQGHHHRDAGLQRSWRRHRRASGVPAGAHVTPLARAHGAPVLAARIRSTPADFFVEELPGFEPSGAGEHLLLTVEKRGMNTAFAAKRIAEWAGVAESAIGYAGMKDRHAVTRQRFSVWIPKKVAPALDALQSDELRVLEHAWHSRKLPRGALAGNRFVLALRDVAGEPAAIEARLRAIAADGVPNYFGEQRFGRGGGNVQQALAMFAGRRVKRERTQPCCCRPRVRRCSTGC